MRSNLKWILILTLAACGGSSVPHETMAASEGSIRAAEEVGASQVPTAALHLQLAKEETERARQLIKNGDNDRAKYVLMRADADAELALALSKEDAAKTDAQAAMEQVRALQEGKTLIR